MALHRMAATVVTALTVLVTVSACSTAGADQTGNNGYVSGDGTITVIDPSDREPAPTVQGKQLGGGTLDTADYAGKTLVLNVWGAWCGECRGEARDLVAASKQLDDVPFVGLDTRDRDSLALSYVRRFDVPYPSLVDQDSKLLLEFYKVVSPNAIPSTLVIDKQGRLAAVINGPTTASTLVDLVDEVDQGS
jgi:peroxiredoxin